MLTLNGMPLSAMEFFDYKERHTRFKPGDTVLLMSDGLPKLINGDNEAFDFPRISMAFQKNAHKSPAEIVDALLAAGDAWRQNTPQKDDMTLIVFKVQDQP